MEQYMKVTINISIFLLVVFVLFHGEMLFAEENEKIILNYTRLGVDQSGDTYFKEESIELNQRPSGFMVSPAESSEIVRFFKAKPGWEMLELHYAPDRQYLLVMQGILEIQCSTGKMKKFGPGSVLFVEDTYGKGHRTRNAGEKDLILVWISVEK
jgi:mannose-6-phosphate isomerase-like protein (cupin superfamily)